MKQLLASVLLPVALSVGSVLTACGGDTTEEAPGDGGKLGVGDRIAFVSNRDSNDEIYVMNGDGSGLTRLTENTSIDQMPAWSPDGRLLAFVSERDFEPPGPTQPPARQLYVMNADGSEQRRLTQTSSDNRTPVWSPDGSRIAYISQYRGVARRTDAPNPRVYVMGSDGSNEIQVGFWDASQSVPVWSPDSRKLAFWTAAGGGLLYVVNADGSDATVLAHSGFPAGPIWSPDGSRILFGCDADICIMNSDGSDQKRMPVHAQYWARPLWWSNDSNTLAFNAFKEGQIVAYLMNADGSNLRQIPDVDLTDASLLYGAAIRRISSVSGGSQLYLMNEDSSDRVLTIGIESGTPVWSADATRIASSISTASGGGYIFIRNADGSGKTIVIPRGDSPSWSPAQAN